MDETNAQYLGCVTSDIPGSHLRQQRFGLGKGIGQWRARRRPQIIFSRILCFQWFGSKLIATD